MSTSRTFRILRRTILTITAVMVLFATNLTGASATRALTGWACSTPPGYVYDEVQYSYQCSQSSWTSPVYHVLAPYDGLTACVSATGWTYDQITYTSGCSFLGTTATTFHLRQPVDGLWACVVPSGWSYTATATTFDCSYTTGVPSTKFQLVH
ncbi:hypothetical protein [Streptosporangium saharense]|uniref:Ig-like domain-containing protein n=1 Tax=Streptosporangium saharense TaxID=1706840 RepID=A0A7W7QTQ3_9ACTN|nr:hypothetical protein [Streptosporangium saharense]MBB4919046.1 hypothetical protein [Streptosporangium saharense]